MEQINKANRLDWWLILIFFGFLGAFSTFQLYDLDTGFHLKVGELILQRGGIPASMDFVYTVPPHPWQDSYWLFQVIAASVWRLGGGIGLCLLRVALIAATFALLCATVRVAARSSTAPSAGCRLPAAFLVPCLLLAALAASNRFRFRPDLFTLLLVAGCFYLLHAYRSGRERLIWLLPLLQVLWVNSHLQLFPLGLGLVGAFLIGGVIEKWWTGAKRLGDGRLVAVALGMGVACLLNPYGYKPLWAPLSAYSLVRSNPYFIAELVPPSFSSALPSAPDLFAYQILIAVSALSLLLSLAVQVARPARGEGQPTGSGLGGAGGGHQAGALRPSLLATHLLIYGAFLYLSLLAWRNVALFAVVAGPIAAIHLREVAVVARRWAERRGGDAVPSFFRSLTVAAPVNLSSAPWLPGSSAPQPSWRVLGQPGGSAWPSSWWPSPGR